MLLAIDELLIFGAGTYRIFVSCEAALLKVPNWLEVTFGGNCPKPLGSPLAEEAKVSRIQDVQTRSSLISGDDFTLREGEALTSPDGSHRLYLRVGGHVQVCDANLNRPCQELPQKPKTINDLLRGDLDFTRLIMQVDGNLALYAWTKAGRGVVICAIGSVGPNGRYTLSITDTGSAIVTGPNGAKQVLGFECATQAQVDAALDR